METFSLAVRLIQRQNFLQNKPYRSNVFILMVSSLAEDPVLRLEVQDLSHVLVLHCLGRIVYGDEADALLRTVTSQDKPHLQIDLSGVDAIDAGGLGVLVELERWARDTRRTIQLINPTKRVREALDTTGLSAVLAIRPSTAQPNLPDPAWAVRTVGVAAKECCGRAR